MTLIVESTRKAHPLGVESRRVRGDRFAKDDVERQRRESADDGRGRPSYNAKGCGALLEEPAIGLWATAAAVEYGVTAVDALELLAYALLLDGET